MNSLLSHAADPLLVGMLILGLAIGNLWRRRGANILGISGLSVLYLTMFVSFTPAAGYIFRATLEWPYPPHSKSPERFDAIVVLMGCLLPSDDDGARIELGPDSTRRCVLAAELYREDPTCLVIVSGGPDPAQSEPTLAEAGKRFLMTLGVTDEQLLLEENSRTTAENAELTCRLLHARGIRKIALVTDATHLWRSEACFRHCDDGLEISTFGTDYRTRRFPWQVLTFLPHASGPRDVGRVAHEWLGIVWYRLSGRI